MVDKHFLKSSVYIKPIPFPVQSDVGCSLLPSLVMNPLLPGLAQEQLGTLKGSWELLVSRSEVEAAAGRGLEQALPLLAALQVSLATRPQGVRNGLRRVGEGGGAFRVFMSSHLC